MNYPRKVNYCSMPSKMILESAASQICAYYVILADECKTCQKESSWQYACDTCKCWAYRIYRISYRTRIWWSWTLVSSLTHTALWERLLPAGHGQTPLVTRFSPGSACMFHSIGRMLSMLCLCSSLQERQKREKTKCLSSCERQALVIFSHHEHCPAVPTYIVHDAMQASLERLLGVNWISKHAGQQCVQMDCTLSPWFYLNEN